MRQEHPAQKCSVAANRGIILFILEERDMEATR